MLKLSHRRLFPSLWSQKVDLGFLEASDYSVPAEDRLAFERNGHVATRGVLSSEQLKALRPSVVRGDLRNSVGRVDSTNASIGASHGMCTFFSLPACSQALARLLLFFGEGVVLRWCFSRNACVHKALQTPAQHVDKISTSIFQRRAKPHRAALDACSLLAQSSLLGPRRRCSVCLRLSSCLLGGCSCAFGPRLFFSGFELQEMSALRQKVSVWFGDETAADLATAPQLRARLKRLAPEEVPFLQVGGTHAHERRQLLTPHPLLFLVRFFFWRVRATHVGSFFSLDCFVFLFFSSLETF